MTRNLDQRKQYRVSGGSLRFYSHSSEVCGGEMRFALFLPPEAASLAPPPLLYWLSGLTCNEENFAQKSGAFAEASRLGMALVMPDTSPRGAGCEGEDESWDFGTGAGFYLDATEAPWSQFYRMETYLMQELPALLAESFSLVSERTGVFGHSMGGHGALTLALRHPERFRSVSAFAPICAPTRCPWGEKAFLGYLGPDRQSWVEHDASELVQKRPFEGKILIDQGTADEFLALQLHSDIFREACGQAGQELELRMQEGYDHSYYFISSFIEDHLRHHAERLG